MNKGTSRTEEQNATAKMRTMHFVGKTPDSEKPNKNVTNESQKSSTDEKNKVQHKIV